jgi:S-adenosylmethionine hydrolase
VSGTIDVLDVRFGSAWTNIPRTQFEQLGVAYGDRVEVCISDGTRTVYRNLLTYAHSFADVYVGEPLVYANSLDCMAVAINQGSFAKAYGIGTGAGWKLSLTKVAR